MLRTIFSSDLSKKLIRLALWGGGSRVDFGDDLDARPADRDRRLSAAGELSDPRRRHPHHHGGGGDRRRAAVLPAQDSPPQQLAEGIGAAAATESDAVVLQGQDEGCARDAEEGERRKGRSSLRPALVSADRPARRRQDHRAGQFRTEISAVARRDAGRRRRRRRNALLRLVVHRGCGADRHRRPLHDAGLRRQGRPAELVRVPRSVEEEPAASADQRRPGGDQPGRPDDR